MLKITNTLTGDKEIFSSQELGKVTLYVCGVTPYSDSHIGHGRCYVSFDILYRVLRFLGYDTIYCRNFTDIDDKLINKAVAQFGDKKRYLEIANTYIAAYHKDMQNLGCLSPTFEPRVTDNIPEIITFIQALLDADCAYEIKGDIYFSIARFSAYPRLSKHDLSQLRAGSRVEVDEYKKDPLDFALWKSEPEGEFWQSPWGWGRPGWHIECSALALKYLGQQIDIHGGGLDLVFPHHDNEIAQSESAHGAQFARYWMHNGFVRINQEKMSKSLGNVWNLSDIFKKYDGMVLRFYILNHHYRAPIEFSFEGLDVASKAYQRLCRHFEKVHVESINTETMLQSLIVKRMVTFLMDDLNTVGMLGVLFDSLGDIAQNPQEGAVIKYFLQTLLGIDLVPLQEATVEITDEITILLQERERARIEKNWAKSDQIRDKLQALGVSLHDKKI